MIKTITTLLAVLLLAAAGAAGAEAPPPLLTFYPQAGVLGRDLFLVNHVDLDEGTGVRDFACGDDTYDGHGGQDSGIRSFREVRIGVPVFAALDGRVVSVQQGVGSDLNWGPTVSNFDTHVILQHGGFTTVYGHLAHRGVRVKEGQWVVAGTQIGLTASSGNSSGPHLHFTIRDGVGPLEPFAGACRPGASGWTAQPPIAREPYVGNVTLSARPFTGVRDIPEDLAVRAGTFVRGVRDVHVRIEVRYWSGRGGGTVTARRPDGSVAGAVRLPAPTFDYGWTKGRLRLDLAQLGRWTLVHEVGGQVTAEAPFDVVARAAQVRNRPPSGLDGVSLEPAAPRAGEVVVCRVATSLVTEDPDYAVMRYVYRWTSGSRVLRQVTSAALSDAIPRTAARAGETLTCTVTPSDGQARGPAASVSAAVS